MLGPQSDTIYSVASTSPPRNPSIPRRVAFADPIVALTRLFSRAAPNKKADLFYTGIDIKKFKLRERLQGGAPLQTSKDWQQAQASTQQHPDSACAATTTAPPVHLTEGQLKKGVLDVSIPSAAYEIACTSHSGLEGNPFIPTDQPYKNIFTVATGHKTPGSRVANLHHPVREPPRTVDIVPGLADQSLLSGGKFAKAGYVSICDDAEVNIYDGRTVRITVSEEAVLKGWRCPRTRMWRIPLRQRL